MSREKYAEDARRWILQAKADLRAARISLDGGSFEWACFQSQQAGEKALKGLWLAHAEDPWGQSLVRLIQTFPEEQIREKLRAHMGLAKQLDKLYIPTRYPNGLPDLSPVEVYTAEEARAAIEAAETLVAGATALAGAEDVG